MRQTFPLTFSQEQRLLSEEDAALHNVVLPVFNLALAIQIEGRINVHSFSIAFERLIQRHEMLRVSFNQRNELSPIQRRENVTRWRTTGQMEVGMFEYRLVDDCSFNLDEYDCSTIDDSLKHKSLDKIIWNAIRWNFDYTMPPLIRATLVRLSENRHYLAIVLPHLICDGESLNIISSDLFSLYASLQGHSRPQLRPLTHQFSDFSRQQVKLLTSSRGISGLKYCESQWEQFGDWRLSPNEILGSPSLSGNRTKRVAITIEREWTTALLKFASTHRSTPNMVLLSSFFITFLHRYHRPKMAILMNFANRSELRFEQVVGWFANYHLIGLDLHLNDTPLDVLSRARLTLVNATLHQNISERHLWGQAARRAPHFAPPVFFNFRRNARSVSKPACESLRFSPWQPLTPGTSEDATCELSRPSRGSNKSIFFDVSLKDNRIELAINCKGNLLGNRLAMESLLYHWAAVICMLPHHANRSLATFRGKAALHASWQQIRTSFKNAWLA